MKTYCVSLALVGLSLCQFGCETLGKRKGDREKSVASYKKGEDIVGPWTKEDLRAALTPGTSFLFRTNNKIETKIELVSSDAESHTIRRSLGSGKPRQKVYSWDNYLGYLKEDFSQDQQKSCEVKEERYSLNGKGIAALYYEISSKKTIGEKSAPVKIELWFAKAQPGLLLRRRAQIGGGLGGGIRSDMKLEKSSLLTKSKP